MKQTRIVVVPAGVAVGGPDTIPGVDVAGELGRDPTIISFLTAENEQFAFVLNEDARRALVQGLTGGIIVPAAAAVRGNGGAEVEG